MSWSAGKAVGIDLGTTYARIAVWDNDHVTIIPNDYGNANTPSYVAFAGAETILGDAAQIQAVSNPHNTIFNVKRLIGRAFCDPEVQLDIKHPPFSVFDRDSKPYIRVQCGRETREFAPGEILSMILTYLKETAEAYLGGPVTSAVIAVPALFNFAQKGTVQRAATISGFNVLRLINDASFSAFACSMDRRMKLEENILILDIGGGCTNVSLVTIEERITEVKATAGAHHLGGADIDHRLVTHLAQKFKQERRKDITGNRRALLRLRIACERAKRTLSTAIRTTISVNSLCDDVDLSTSITRAELEDLCQDLFQSVSELVEKVIRDAMVDKAAVNEIVLVGGSTRIPRIRSIVSDIFNGNPPTMLQRSEATVVSGAAIQAAILTGNTSEKTQDSLLLDVISRSLGICTAGGVMTPLIKRNTTIPTKKAQIFSTTRDNQCDMVIEVYEGEQARTQDNTLMGRLLLSGIPPAPRGVPEIEVTFNMDGNEHLIVSVTDKGTGGSIRYLDISNKEGGLSDAAMAEMVAADKQLELAARTRLETYVRKLRTALRELEPTLKDARSWLASEAASLPIATVEEYKARQNRLDDAVRPIAELFAASAAAGGPNDSPILAAGVVDEEAMRRWVEVRLPAVYVHDPSESQCLMDSTYSTPDVV